ncbi:MAG TPA: hypothetical protein PLQ12_08995 [Candidatus Defluviicoccus seviourii]|nr:hypothetical protein [Candidatus Defluviicoccus seviourii]
MRWVAIAPYYSCRHTYATFRILYGPVNVFVLAEKKMGTSVPMIKTYYSHLTPTMARGELTQIAKRERRGLPSSGSIPREEASAYVGPAVVASSRQLT